MKQIRTHSLWRPLALLLADGLLFGLTDPNRVPALVLVAGFLLLCLTLYQLLRLVFQLLRWYGVRSKHERSLMATMTGLGAGLIALQSSGQLSQRDILVLVPLVLVAYLYMSYGRARPEN